MTDADLIHIVQHGVAGTGMPAFGFLGDEKIKAIVAHLRKLQGVGTVARLPGDPAHGEQIFFGEAGCGSCHMVSGRGGFLASDLSAYGNGHSAQEARAGILQPADNAHHKPSAVYAFLKNGEKIEGIIRSQDNFSIVLQLRNGSFRRINRQQLLRTEPDPSMMMPTDYHSRLSDKELDDLVSFLLKTKDDGR